MIIAILTLTLSCAVFASCKTEPPKENRKITWTYDAATVTITPNGYETLPTELEEETVVSFTLTPATGYEIVAVTTAKKQDDGSYSFTVAKKDITIKVTTGKILNDIDVTVKKTPLTYFEDEKVQKEDLEVTAKYALGDEVTTDYTVTYANGDAFVSGDTYFTVNIGNKTKQVDLAEAVTTSLSFNSAELKVNAENQPVLVVKGVYHASGDTKAAVEGFINNCTERGSWASKEFKAEATVAADKSFTLTLTITGEIKNGGQYYFHVKDGADGNDLSCPLVNETAKPGKSNDNITAEFIGDPVVSASGVEYYVGHCEDWGSKAIMIVVVDATAKEVSINSIALENRNGVATLIYTGTSKNMTRDDFATFYFDYEDTEAHLLTFTVESFDENGNFVISANVTDLPSGTNWLHHSAKGTNVAGADNAVEGKTEITVGEKTYTLNYSEYNCWQIVVS